MTAWVVRAGASGENEGWNLEKGRAGVGFAEVGDLTGCGSREDVRARVAAAYPDAPALRRANFTGQLWALRNSIAVGDVIVMPLKTQAGYLAMGRCTAGYAYDAGQQDPERRHHIQVDWAVDPVPRSVLKDDLLNMVNGAMTVFSPSRNSAAARLEVVSERGVDPGNSVSSTVPSDPAGQTNRDVDATVTDPETAPTMRAIRDKVLTHVVENFSGHKLTNLVADILTALGFVCEVSPAGPDGGVDILAGMGPLGLDSPTLVVEVKSEVTPVGAQVFRSLHSAVAQQKADQGLLVAWGGLSGPARREAAQQRTTIRIWDAEAVLDRLFEVYPRLPDATRSRIPLTQAWVLDDDQQEV